MPTLNVFCASGGGARGAFQGGVLEALGEAQIELHGLVGVSTGAIQAGYLSVAPPGLDEQMARVRSLKDLWFGLEDDSDVYDKPFLGPVSLLLGSPSLFGLRPLKRLLEAHLRDAPRRPVRLGIVDLGSGAFEPRDPRTAEDLRTAILASSSIPFAFPPVARALVDGGVREIAPLDLAFELAAEMKAQSGASWDSVRVFVALASPRRAARAPRADWGAASAFEIGRRALDLLENENYFWDVECALRVNELLRLYGSRPDLPPFLHGKIHGRIDVFEPAGVPDSPLEFRPDRIRALWAQGRATARQVLEESRPEPPPRSRQRLHETGGHPARAGVDA